MLWGSSGGVWPVPRACNGAGVVCCTLVRLQQFGASLVEVGAIFTMLDGFEPFS